jgi:hypothetical protein
VLDENLSIVGEGTFVPDRHLHFPPRLLEV